MTTGSNGYTADEITVTADRSTRKSKFTLEGGFGVSAHLIISVLKSVFDDFDPRYIARANFSKKLDRSSDLACAMALLFVFYKKPIPVDTAFIASFDASGELLPVDNMTQRVKRARDQGYSRVIGPKKIGSQDVIWEEVGNIADVWKALDFEVTANGGN
jgi:hypothetical protein